MIGKLSFTDAQILENYQAFRESLDKVKPEAMKGRLIRRVVFSSTMGPGLIVKI